MVVTVLLVPINHNHWDSATCLFKTGYKTC